MNLWNKEKYVKYAKEIFTCDSPTGYTIEVIKLIEEYVKQRTNMKTKQLKEIREKKIDFYMDANEAIELRICYTQIRVP